MNKEQFEKLVQHIVHTTKALVTKHVKTPVGPVDYVAIFARSEEEFQRINTLVQSLGKAVQTTPTGSVYQLAEPITIKDGSVKLVKVRKYDSNRSQRGDADFVVIYPVFKKQYLGQPGFNLIERKNFEMVELSDPDFDVLAYFPDTPLSQDLGLQ